MATCTKCGNDVTGKKFCPDCGTPVASTAPGAASTCPQCHGAVKPGAAFCMHCGTALASAVSATPATRSCPTCQASVLETSAFCNQCGHNMNMPAASSGLRCSQCGHQNAQGMRFCGECGTNLLGGVSASSVSGQYGQTATQTTYTQYPTNNPYPADNPYSSPQYPAQPYGQQPQIPQMPQPPQMQQMPQMQQQYPQQPQYQQQQAYPQQQPYPQQQYQQQYAPGGYQPQPPMLGQAPMVLRCPTCMAMYPLGTGQCVSCHTSLAGIVPTPANMPAQGQQAGMGGFLQGNGGKIAMGVLGGAAAVIGGEMLMNGIENKIEGDIGYGGRHHHHRHQEDGGLLGGIGHLADDIGLF